MVLACKGMTRFCLISKSILQPYSLGIYIYCLWGSPLSILTKIGLMYLNIIVYLLSCYGCCYCFVIVVVIAIVIAIVVVDFTKACSIFSASSYQMLLLFISVLHFVIT